MHTFVEQSQEIDWLVYSLDRFFNGNLTFRMIKHITFAEFQMCIRHYLLRCLNGNIAIV